MKSQKRYLLLLLILTSVLCLTAVCAAQATDEPAETPLMPLPQIGETVSGFKAISSDAIPHLNAQTMLFEHEQSGGQVLYIQNADNNLGFSATFQTWAYTNKGMAHVLEHSLLSSSEKYPGNSVFFDLINRAYLTFANAFTAQNYTFYPITTTSQKEFLNATDFYLDVLLHPGLRNDDHIFMREGIRYELADVDAVLKPVGVVYNEMQQSSSMLSNQAFYNAKALLYPQTPDRFISGGDPNEILDLSYDELIAFYNNYYSPSRMKIIIYGNLDYKAFLEQTDRRFLAGVEKMEPLIEPAEQTAFDAVKFESFAHPVSQDATLDQQSYIFYLLGAPRDITPEVSIGLRLLMNRVFNNESFPLLHNLMESGIAADYASFFEDDMLQPTFGFLAAYSSADGAQQFYDTIQRVLTEQLEKGLDKELLRAVVNQQLMEVKLAGESGTRGFDTMTQMVSDWQVKGDPLLYARMPAYLDGIAAKIDEGFFEELIRKYILDNTLASVATTYPEAGLMEKNEAALAERLTAKQAAMSDAQKQALVDATAEFNQWLATNKTPQTTLDSLSVVTVADLPENVDNFEIVDETLDGVRIVSTVSALPDVSSAGMSFDISGLDMETLQYLDLYAALVGRLPTEKYSVEALSLEKTRLLHSVSSALAAQKLAYRSNEWRPVFNVGWVYLTENTDAAADLMYQILYTTKLNEDSIPQLKNVLSQQLGAVSAEMNSYIYYSIQRGLAQVDSAAQFENYFNYDNYKAFLNTVIDLLETDPTAVLQKLAAARQAALNKNGLIVIYAGEEGSKTRFATAVQTLIDSASDELLPAAANSYPVAPADEAMMVDSSVSYNAIQAANQGLIPYSNGLSVISTVVRDKLIFPKIREEGGAYGGALSFGIDHFQMYSYQDPNVSRTFEVFRSVPQFLQTLQIDQADLDQYIITTYAKYEDTSGSLTRAMTALVNHLIGKTTADTLNEFGEIKGVVPAYFTEVGAEMEQAMADASILTFGSQSVIEQNKDLYQTVNDIR